MRFIILVGAASLLGFPALNAQLSVDPLEISIVPAGSGRVAGTIRVRNPGSAPVQATVTRGDWERAENGDNRFHPSGTLGTSCGALLSVFPSVLMIDAKGSATVRLALDASPSVSRECWDVIFIEEQTAKRKSASGSSLQYFFRTGVKVYVTPPGLSRSGEIQNLSLEAGPGARSASLNPVATRQGKLVVRYSNSGGIHHAASGRVEFRRPDNSVAAEVAIPEFAVLPGASRELRLTIPADLLPGTYVALVLIDFGGNEIAAGQLELDLL